MKKFRGLILVLVLLFGAVALNSSVENSISGASTKTIKKTLYLNKGAKKKLSLSSGKGTWKTNSKSVVPLRTSKDSTKNYSKLSKKKSVYVYAKGLSQNSGKKVTVSANGKKYQYTIFVGEKPSLSQKSITLKVGEETTVSVQNWGKLIKAKKNSSSCKWTNSNSGVASSTLVGDKSKLSIKGKSVGTTKMNFKYNGGTYSVTVKVVASDKDKDDDSDNGNTNTDTPPADSALPEMEWDMKGASIEFYYTHWGNKSGCGWRARSNTESTIVNEAIKYLYIKEKGGNIIPLTNDILNEIKFVSSNPSVATVEKFKIGSSSQDKIDAKNGKCAIVTAKSAGTTTITCTTPKNSFSIVITVIDNIKDLRTKEINTFIQSLPSGATNYQKMEALKKHIDANYVYQTASKTWNLAENGGKPGYEYMYYGGDCSIYYRKEGTCTSFAALVSDFCHSMGIECYTVYYTYSNGGEHVENYVKLDGKYYIFDASKTPSTLFREVSVLPSSATKVTGWFMGDSYEGG